MRATSLRLLSPANVSLRLPLLEMPDWAMMNSRDPVGLELARRMPGGVVAIWKRDAFGRPTLRHVLTGARAEPRDGWDARGVPVASVILSRNDDVRDAARRGKAVR